jgi:hypothetical protein
MCMQWLGLSQTKACGAWSFQSWRTNATTKHRPARSVSRHSLSTSARCAAHLLPRLSSLSLSH